MIMKRIRERFRFGIGQLLVLVMLAALGLWGVTQYVTETVEVTVLENNLYRDSNGQVSGNLTFKFATPTETRNLVECSVYRLLNTNPLELPDGSTHKLRYRSTELGPFTTENPIMVFITRKLTEGQRAKVVVVADVGEQFQHYVVEGQFPKRPSR